MIATARLGDLARGRDNNLNLLRFLAASAVVYAHSFGILGKSESEPFFALMGRGLGDFGVDIFFVISGFLVTKSLFGKESVGLFAWARIVRVFPALWISTLLWVLIAGLFFTPLSSAAFWSQSETLTYVAKNLTMLPGIGAQLQLPNAFPFPTDEFNVPLWTLPHELQMYALLALLGAIGLARFGSIFLGIVFFALAGLILNHAEIGLVLSGTRLRFLFFFFAGATMYSYRDVISLRSTMFWTLCGVVGAVCLLTQDRAIRQLALGMATPYLVMVVAYGPGGAIRRFNALGDYSYGIYILAFPIQLALAGYSQIEQPLVHFVLSLCAVLPFAVASWHFLEGKALRTPPPAFLARVVRLTSMQPRALTKVTP